MNCICAGYIREVTVLIRSKKYKRDKTKFAHYIKVAKNVYDGGQAKAVKETAEDAKDPEMVEDAKIVSNFHILDIGFFPIS